MKSITFDVKDTEYVSQFPPIPEWLSNEGLTTLQRGYLLPGETPRDLYYRVACNAARILERPELMKDFFDILWFGFLGLATPVASNFGTNRGLPISCYSLHISDSIPSIYSHLKEAAMMSKHGGGIGIYCSDVRPSGSKISDGGIATGVVPIAQQYDKCAGYVSQNGLRKGSFAMYLDISHPDAYELLLAKDHLEGDPRKMIDSNIAFTVTDEFIEKLLNGDVIANKVWAKALETNLKTGSPYFIFIDNVNRQNPPAYINHGLKVSTSNLCCLSGDTNVLIKNNLDEGPISVPIKDLVGKEVYIYDGYEWELNNNFKQYDNSLLYEVYVDFQGTIHKYEMTGNHRCVLYDEYEQSYFIKTVDEILNSDESYSEFKFVYNSLDFTNANYGTLVTIKKGTTIKATYCTTVPSTGMFKLGTDMMTGNSEIMLYTDENHSFVCCLSSLNLYKWDEWKDWCSSNSNKSVVELSVYLLDAVLEEFIRKAKGIVGMGRSVRSAEKGRAIGIGTMGLAYLYQKKGLPFKSHEARQLNIDIFKQIQEESYKASELMAIEYGIPEWCEGTNRRHSHTCSTAPTRTNSIISGAFSPGIEPIDSNSYTAKQAKGSFIRKNDLLRQLLQSKGKDTPEIWDSILSKNGSVMHLDFLTIDEKLVFLTAREIDQEELIRQACDRTPYIDQGQSLNRFVHPDIPVKHLNELVLKAWKGGTKSTYYTKASSDKIIEKVRNEAHIITKKDCPYCDKTKQLFSKLNITYTEYDRNDVTIFPWKTVPQIWLETHYIGGYEELLDYTKNATRNTEFNNIQNDLNNINNVNITNFVHDAQATLNNDEIDYKECESCSG